MNKARILFLTLMTIGCPALASAETPAKQLDIVGLKLGMTIADATQQLKQYDKNIKITTLYLVQDSVNGSSKPEAMIDFFKSEGQDSSRFKIPVVLIGIDIKQAWDASSNLITSDSTGVQDFSGEYFQLSFIPTDTGGKLYAIERTYVYDSGFVRPNPSPPSGNDLNSSFIKKYGQPSSEYDPNSTTDWQIIWLYDERGRLLANSQPEFQRCAYDDTNGIKFKGIPPNFSQGLTAPNLSLGLINHSLDMASSNFDGSPVNDNSVPDTKTVADAFLQMGYNQLTPDYYFSGATPTQVFRQCGIELETSVTTDGTSNAGTALPTTQFTELLVDQNAAFYDNGWKSYIQKLLSATPAAPTAAAPNL